MQTPKRKKFMQTYNRVYHQEHKQKEKKIKEYALIYFPSDIYKMLFPSERTNKKRAKTI